MTDGCDRCGRESDGLAECAFGELCPACRHDPAGMHTQGGEDSYGQ